METALIGFCGVLIGAALQFLFNFFLKRAELESNAEAEACLTFLKGISIVAISQSRNDSQKEQEGLALVTEGKARIVAYGRPELVAACAEFWEHGAVLNSAESNARFIKICEAMRKTIQITAVPRGQIEALLLK